MKDSLRVHSIVILLIWAIYLLYSHFTGSQVNSFIVSAFFGSLSGLLPAFIWAAGSSETEDKLSGCINSFALIVAMLAAAICGTILALIYLTRCGVPIGMMVISAVVYGLIWRNKPIPEPPGNNLRDIDFET